MLRPGGLIVFAGEPSRYGDRLAALPKRTGVLVAPAWRRVVGARERAVAEADQSEGHSLEGEVDVHAFAPADLRRLLERAEFDERRVGGEELLANAWGWGLRTVESSAEPDTVPFRWRQFAFRSYIALQKVDTRLLEPRLPAELFYNLLVSARKPALVRGPTASRAAGEPGDQPTAGHRVRDLALDLIPTFVATRRERSLSGWIIEISSGRCEAGEGVVAGGERRLGRVAAAPGLRSEAPAELRPRRELGQEGRVGDPDEPDIAPASGPASGSTAQWPNPCSPSAPRCGRGRRRSPRHRPRG